MNQNLTKTPKPTNKSLSTILLLKKLEIKVKIIQLTFIFFLKLAGKMPFHKCCFTCSVPTHSISFSLRKKLNERSIRQNPIRIRKKKKKKKKKQKIVPKKSQKLLLTETLWCLLTGAEPQQGLAPPKF